MQTSPLAALLPEGEEALAATRLQALLRDGLELLRPASSVPAERPEWYGYRILTCRYLQLRHMQTVCDDLALSTASLYRYQQQAIEALAAILWRQGHPQSATPEPPPAPRALTLDEQAVQEAVQLARAARQEPVDLAGLLEHVRQTSAALARRHATTVTLAAPAALPTVYGDAAVLHQMMVNLIAGALEAGHPDTLRLELRAQGREIVGRLTGLRLEIMAPGLLAQPAFVLARELLAVYGGRLEIELPALRFTLPSDRRQVILIIEDHEDTIQLYQRYLQRRGYAVRVAQRR